MIAESSKIMGVDSVYEEFLSNACVVTIFAQTIFFILMIYLTILSHMLQ